MEDNSSSSVAVADAPEAASGVHSAQGHPHPGQAQYVLVAVILAVITAAEVAVYYVGVTGKPLVAILVGLASI